MFCLAFGMCMYVGQFERAPVRSLRDALDLEGYWFGLCDLENEMASHGSSTATSKPPKSQAHPQAQGNLDVARGVECRLLIATPRNVHESASFE
jgi:hypothetical protein